MTAVVFLGCVGAKAPWAQFHLSWIPLHGVSRELLDDHRVLHGLSELEPRRRSYADYGAAIYLAARATLESLSDEEHVGDHIDRTFTIDEVDRILHDLMMELGNEVKLAAHIARKVRSKVQERLPENEYGRGGRLRRELASRLERERDGIHRAIDRATRRRETSIGRDPTETDGSSSAHGAGHLLGGFID